MGASFATVRACVADAIRGFAWREFAPFAGLFALEAAVLTGSLGLGSAWGMATVGALAAAAAGDAATHYPAHFTHLPIVFSFVESAAYVLVGSFLIPIAVSRIVESHESEDVRAGSLGGRALAAVLPTFLALLASFGLMYLWQLALPKSVVPLFQSLFGGGLRMVAATWLVSVLVSYALATLVLYVPIVGVRGRLGPGATLARGVRDGLRLLPGTLFFVVLFALPALAVQFAVQTQTGFVVQRFRPELVLVLLLAYALLTNLAAYLGYGAAARLHAATSELEA